MAESVRTARKGDLSTYEHAPDEFLTNRAAELHARLAEPGLGFGDFLQGVFSHVVVTAGAVAWSVWNGMRQIVFGSRAVNSRLTLTENGVTHQFVHDVPGINRILTHWAEDYAGRTLTPVQLVESMLNHGQERQMKIAMDETRAFLETLREAEKAGKPIEEQWTMLRNFLVQLADTQPNAFLARFGEMVRDVEQQRVNGTIANPRLAVRRINLDTITGQLEGWNTKILNKYRKPATLVAAGTVGLVTGVFAYRGTRHAKSLDDTVELTYIQRIEADRAAARERTAMRGGA